VQYPELSALEPADLERLKEVVATSGSGVLQVEAGGDLFWNFEQPETEIAEIVGLLVAVVVLVLAFGSVAAAGLPIATALFGLGIGIGSLALVSYVVEVPSFATVMASMVGLGVGIDYALFVVTRHREHLAAGMDVVESVGLANATAGRSVVFAGGTVVLSILGLAVAGLPFLTAAGIAISLVVLVMVVAAVTLLPALLGLAGHRIDRWRVHRRDGRAGAERWMRWARHVTRHPVPYAIGATALLLAFAAPVLALRLGVPDEGRCPRPVPSAARTTWSPTRSVPAPTGRCWWRSTSTTTRRSSSRSPPPWRPIPGSPPWRHRRSTPTPASQRSSPSRRHHRRTRRREPPWSVCEPRCSPSCSTGRRPARTSAVRPRTSPT
jgi:hypothetical protein